MRDGGESKEGGGVGESEEREEGVRRGERKGGGVEERKRRGKEEG